MSHLLQRPPCKTLHQHQPSMLFLRPSWIVSHLRQWSQRSSQRLHRSLRCPTEASEAKNTRIYCRRASSPRCGRNRGKTSQFPHSISQRIVSTFSTCLCSGRWKNCAHGERSEKGFQSRWTACQEVPREETHLKSSAEDQRQCASL